MQFIRERAEERVFSMAKAYKLILAAEEFVPNTIRASSTASHLLDSSDECMGGDPP
jgi:hypothetical protein